MSTANVDMTMTIEFESKTATFKRPTPNNEGEFTTLIRNRALAAGEFYPDPARRKEIFGAVAGDISTGKYEWEGGHNDANYVVDALNGPLSRQWLFILLKTHTPFLVNEDGRKWYKRLCDFKEEERNDEGQVVKVAFPKWDELVEKYKVLTGPNPQTPLDTKRQPGA